MLSATELTKPSEKEAFTNNPCTFLNYSFLSRSLRTVLEKNMGLFHQEILDSSTFLV